MVSDGQTHLHTDLIKQSEHQNATWHETQGLMPALVRSNGLRAENQQLCRDPCVLFECMLTSVSAVVRVSGLDHCANNDWDFILHHLKRECYWRWYLLPCKISKLVHPNCVLAPPPLGCKERKLRWRNLNFFGILGYFWSLQCHFKASSAALKGSTLKGIFYPKINYSPLCPKPIRPFFIFRTHL